MLFVIAILLPIVIYISLVTALRVRKCPKCGKLKVLKVTSVSPIGENPLGIAMTCRRLTCHQCKILDIDYPGVGAIKYNNVKYE